MQYFKKSVGQNPKFPKTCSRVNFFKKTKEGASIMCQVVEEYAAEKTKQTEIKWQQTFWKMVYLLTLLLNQHLRLRMILLQNWAKKYYDQAVFNNTPPIRWPE